MNIDKLIKNWRFKCPKCESRSIKAQYIVGENTNKFYCNNCYSYDIKPIDVKTGKLVNA